MPLQALIIGTSFDFDKIFIFGGRLVQGEKVIENSILSWLKWKGIFAMKIKTTGTFDQKIGKFRKPSPWYRKGVSDILGIYKGKFLAIEVKSAKGRLSPNQIIFQQEVTEHGGYALTIKSIEELELQLKIIDLNLIGNKC